jgi:hypothetical protein
VFDDEHRVADVAQVLEQADETIVVARVQTDRRLVEHVKRADERRAEIVASWMRWASPPRASKRVDPTSDSRARLQP